ncbi:MAG: alpha/beta hydrolase [Gemmataceae bacterium]|nr:alpha/beta hydrolase [Gemmataceae bacterium]
MPRPHLAFAARRVVLGLLLPLLFAAFNVGCTRHLAASVSAPPPPAICVGDPIILFVADGAGNFQSCSRTLRAAISEKQLPIEVRTFEWSHGYLRVLADQLGYQHAREQGKRLAAEMEATRREQPNAHIHVLAHSAGSTVLLSALEHVSPGTVEHAFLLAPSCSSEYHLRPALRNVGKALHLHCSEHDFWHLGLAIKFVGTTDRMFLTPAAGRIGFTFHPESGEDQLLAAKLVQRRWMLSDFLLKNDGGHYGAYHSPYVDQTIFPYLLGRPARSEE